MATIKNISQYLLSVSLKDHPIFSLEPGKQRDGLDDDKVREWAKGQGIGFLRPPHGGGEAIATVRFDKPRDGDPASAPATVKVFIGGVQHEVHPDVAAKLESLTAGQADTPVLMGVETKKVQPEPTGSQEPVSSQGSDSGVQLSVLQWNSAIKHVGECDDLDQLQNWLEVEERPKVVEALNTRIEELLED